jgi:hypothetical protein
MRLHALSLVLLAALVHPPARVHGGFVGHNGFNLLPAIGKIPLTSQSLQDDPTVQSCLRDGNSQFLEQAASCALEGGDKLEIVVDGKTYTFPGMGGLAPQWKTGPCDQDCQEHVTGCMMSQINRWGLPVHIFFAFTHPDETGQPDLHGYTVEDGAFFGNLFADPPQAYACQGRGDDSLMRVFRRCAQHPVECGFEDMGPCVTADGRGACEGFDDTVAAYRDCHGTARSAEGSFPAGDHAFWPMTIYVRPTLYCASP